MTPGHPDMQSFDDGFRQKGLTYGRVLVNKLAILVRVAQMHAAGNVAVDNAAEAALAVLREMFGERGSFSLTLIGEYFFLEGERIKYRAEDYPNFELLVSEFKRRRLGSLSFNSVVDAAELVSFARVFLASDISGQDAYHDLARRLGASGVSGLATGEVRAAKARQDEDDRPGSSGSARRSYVRVVAATRRLMTGIAQGQPPDIRMLKRATQSLVETVYANEPELIRLSAVRSGGNVLNRHYANVAVLSLCLGKRLGLSKYQMGRLGIAALLHDIGRLDFPEDILDKADDPASAAGKLFRRHPEIGLQTLLRLKGLNEVAVSAMIVAYEHHRNLDGTGYPASVRKKEMNLFSRIVRVADNYDATTSSGIYGMIPVLPYKSVELMLTRSGQYYDPGILELFTAMVGVYPAGSLVMLSDGRMGVVSEPGRAVAGRPRVRIVMSRVRTGGYVWEEVDTGGKDENGNYKVDVAGALDPYKCGVDIYRYLFD
ncbi:MAG: HD domain-containing protein [Nitrospirae bacterium]|nr:HD domain-containing protein [Nitrospirota bacterium]